MSHAELLPLGSQMQEFPDADPDVVEAASPKWILKELKPMHKQVCAFLAQGMKNVDVARLCQITPEYVWMLTQQPLVKQYIAQMSEVAGTRLEAMFEKTVDVLAETMENGSESGKLKAVRLTLEATKRIGRPDPMANSQNVNTDRLEKLAERLLFLQSGVRQGRTFDEAGNEVVTS
jgi:hypothetical protein